MAKHTPVGQLWGLCFALKMKLAEKSQTSTAGLAIYAPIYGAA